MDTRGQRIRRARNLKRLTIKQVATAVGISERTLRSIELDERPDTRTADLVEAYLGLTEETPPRIESPPLDRATNAELATEVYRRLMRMAQDDQRDGEIPQGAAEDPGLILGPPDPETRRTKESDG